MRKLLVVVVLSVLVFAPTTPALVGGAMVRAMPAPQAVPCELFGHHVDGRALWIGDCAPDCAPVVMRGLAMGHKYFAASTHTEQSFVDRDVYFGNQSSGWNQPVP